MPKPKDIPFSSMKNISASGVFVKQFDRSRKTEMKDFAHRDDYYMVVFLTEGAAEVEVDFERKKLEAGNLLVVSPWQVHGRPSGEVWQCKGWLLAFAPEILSDVESRTIEDYAVSTVPLSPGMDVINDIEALCPILERNQENHSISTALASAVKSFVLSSLETYVKDTSGRYRTIVVKLRKLLDMHMSVTKSPAAYALMLNISEVYLNEAVKGATGLNVSTYIRNRLMIQAKRQLAYSSLASKEIAYNLGYEDYAYFSRLFKKSAGVSPSEYRKNLK